MRDLSQIPAPLKVLAIAVVLVIGGTLVVLFAGKDQEQPETAESIPEADSASSEQPTEAPPEPEQVAEEPSSEPVPTVEIAATEAPTLTPAPASAEMDEYVSITEFFNLKVPTAWSVEETMPGAAIVMANSEEALARFQVNSAIEPEDFVINVGFLPYRLLQTNELRSLNFAFDAAPDVFLQSLLPMFRTEPESDLSNVELVSLDGVVDAGRLVVSDAGREGMVLMFPVSDSVIALVSTVGFPGELAEYEELTYGVASGATFSGEQDVLYGTLLGG